MTVNVDGSRLLRLTRGEPFFWDGAWSPDGRRIAVTKQDETGLRVYLMNADGSELSPLTEIESSGPTWSPDGRFIVFSGNPEGHEADRLYRVDVETGESTVLVQEANTLNQCPVWSPEGDLIAFYRLGVSEVGGQTVTVSSELMAADPGGTVQPLVADSLSSCPTWSPDGDEVLIVGRQELEFVDVITGGRRRLEGSIGASDPDWA